MMTTHQISVILDKRFSFGCDFLLSPGSGALFQLFRKRCFPDEIWFLAARRAAEECIVLLSNTGSILPLRYPDAWDRFQYQSKIVEINAEQAEWSCRNLAGFLDFHALLRDADGQLGAAYARPDGTHLTFEAYCRMSELVQPLLK